MISLNLGEKFDTSNVTNMNTMFNECGYTKLTSLDLGDKFDTTNVTDMGYMFNSLGYTLMTSLDLGDKFNTNNVDNMAYMFLGCGNTLMTQLDLGPGFTQIPDGDVTLVSGTVVSANKRMFINCGTTGCIIYAPEAIFFDENNFKLNASATTAATELNYTIGTINPIYRPIWTYDSNTIPDISATEPSMEVIVQGKTYKNQTIGNITINYESPLTSTLTSSGVTVYMDGVQNSDIVVGTPEVEGYIDEDNDGINDGVIYKFTLSSFNNGRVDGKPFSEWSGNMSLEIAKGTLTDTLYGNKNLLDEIDDESEPEDVDTNTENALFSDAIKPEYTYVSSNTTIDISEQKVTIIFDVVDEYFSSTSLSNLDASQISVLVNDFDELKLNDYLNTNNYKTLTKVQDITYTVNGVADTKVGERYQLEILGLDGFDNGFKYSGYMTLSFSAGTIVDKSGNLSDAKSITIGIDDPEGTGTDPIVVDVVKPVWIADNVTKEQNAQGQTVVTIDLIATDKYFNRVLVEALDEDGDGTPEKTAEQVLLEQIKILDENGANETFPLQKDLEFATNRYVKVEWDDDSGDYVITEAEESTANGIKYKLTISNMEESDEAFATAISNGRIYREYSGITSIEVPEGTVEDKSGNTNEELIINLGKIDTLGPEIIEVSSTPDSNAKTDEIIFNITDKYLNTLDALEASEILVYVDNELIGDTNGNGEIDGEETQDIYKQLSVNTRAEDTLDETENNTFKTNGEIWTEINGTQKMIGMQYKLLVQNLEEATRNSKEYKDWSGTVSIKITEGAVEDESGNTNKEKTIVGDFVDYIKPDIEYRHQSGDIKTDTNKYVMTFDITDKYYSSGVLTTEDIANGKIEILMQNGQLYEDGTPIIYNLKDELGTVAITLSSTEIKKTFNKTVSGVVTQDEYTIGHTYTLTISNLEELKIKSGLTTADYSGMITVAIDGDMIKDTTNNGNSQQIITAGVDFVGGEESGTAAEIDVVDPIWKKDKGSSVNFETQEAVIIVSGTDTYFDPTNTSLTDSDIALYAVTTQEVDGEETMVETQLTDGITISVSDVTTPLTEQRLQNNNVTTVQYGIQYEVTITGFSIDVAQLKMRIASGIMTDLYSNTNKTTDINLFNCLRVAKDGEGNYESTATSGFLGNDSIDRQDIENVAFVSNIAGSEDEAVQQVWDVSEAQDESILAWTSQTSAPYTVYIGSNETIFANKDSSYLFSYIGYSTSCDDTETISNIEQLFTLITTDMSYMFNYCGYRSMTKLDLKNNFITKRVTNMSNMFNSCGQLKMTELNLSADFNTSRVEDMSNMFNSCGLAELQTFELSELFNTTKVENMSGMFQNFGQTKLQELDLGNTFYTTSVTDMDNMFNGCGTTAMTKLDLGPAFTKIASEHENFMTNCGKSTLVIYAPEAIYSNWTSFK